MKLLQLSIICMVIIMAAASCAPAGDTTTSATGEPQTTATTSSLSGLFADYDDCGELGAALEENEKETFAGCWLEHPGDSFVIAFTRDGETTIRNYVQEGSSLDNRIKLITLDTPLAELLSIQQQTMDMLVDLGLFCGGSTDVKENVVKVYVTDSVLFDRTLAEAGVTLPDHVITEIVYEPLREVPFEVNPPEGVHFPQLKMASSMYMLALMTGTLELKNGYLYVGEAVIIWQPDYFLHEHDGHIEVLDREGQVVGRVGEEIVMGGGHIGFENINRMLKEPLHGDFTGDCFLQGSGTRLSLNFNSDLFGLQVLERDSQQMYFLTQKPALLEAVPAADWYYVETCEFTASAFGNLLKHPRYGINEGMGKVGLDDFYTTFWPEGFRARMENGVVEILDGAGSVVVRDGEKVFVKGNALRMFGSYSDLTRQLYDELPARMENSYYIVREVIPWQPDPEIVTTSLVLSGGIPVNITAPADLVFSDIRLEPGLCDRAYHPITDPPSSFEIGDACLILTGTVRNLSPNRFELSMGAVGLNEAGEKVAVTLDAAHIVGAIGLHAKHGETAEFIIHLNPCDDLVFLDIRAGSATIPFP